MTEPKDLKKEAPKKKGFKMPDIYIVLGTFILFMALLTYIVPAGQYDRQVVETAHGVQNLVVAGTYKPVHAASGRLARRCECHSLRI